MPESMLNMKKFKVEGGRNSGMELKGEFVDDNILYIIRNESFYEIAADGSITTSKMRGPIKIVYMAGQGEKIVECCSE